MHSALRLVLPILMLAAPLAARAAEGTVPSADGVSIHYTTEGEGSPALVFVHGWTGDTRFWDAQVKHFSPKRRVVAIDLAGHGASGKNRGEWTIAAFGQDVRAVVEKLGLKKVVLVGHSMGGSVIVEAARLMPDRVALLVPVDSLHDLGLKPTDEQREGFLAPFRQDFAANAAAFIRKFFPEGTDPALVDRVARGAASAPPAIMVACLEGLFKYDLAAALPRVKAPIHAVNADGYPTNVEGNRRLAAGYEATIMPGVGHFPMIVAPAKFNEILDKVVEKGTKPSPAP